jgi:hypothetical protein
MKVEYAVMLCNCFPKQVPMQHFESSAGDHDKVELDLEFACTPYHGIDVNEKAKLLLKRNQIMVNSLEFCTGLDVKSSIFQTRSGYDPTTGQIKHGTTLAGAGLSYRTAVNNDNESATTQNLDVDSTDKATPSYTDIGNRSQSIS